jgi:hypothetical protein
MTFALSVCQITSLTEKDTDPHNITPSTIQAMRRYHPTYDKHIMPISPTVYRFHYCYNRQLPLPQTEKKTVYSQVNSPIKQQLLLSSNA